MMQRHVMSCRVKVSMSCELIEGIWVGGLEGIRVSERVCFLLFVCWLVGVSYLGTVPPCHVEVMMM